MKRTLSLCLALLLMCSALIPAVLADVEPGYDQVVLEADTGNGLKKMPYKNTYEQYYAADGSGHCTVSSTPASGGAPMAEKTVVRTYAVWGESEERSILLTVPYDAYVYAYERKAEGEQEAWLGGAWDAPGTTYLITLNENVTSEYPTICLKGHTWDSFCLYVQEAKDGASGSLREILQFTYGVNTPSLLDVANDAWYAPYARKAAVKGWLYGDSSRMFRPNEVLTKAGFLTALWKMEGSPILCLAKDYPDHYFGELAARIPAYAKQACFWACEEGLLTGTYSIVHIQEPISRQDALTVLYRYARYKQLDLSAGEDTNVLSYDDSFQFAEYAIPAIQWACGSGLAQGSGSSFRHDAPLTRAQAAKLMCLFAQL